VRATGGIQALPISSAVYAVLIKLFFANARISPALFCGKQICKFVSVVDLALLGIIKSTDPQILPITCSTRSGKTEVIQRKDLKKKYCSNWMVRSLLSVRGAMYVRLRLSCLICAPIAVTKWNHNFYS